MVQRTVPCTIVKGFADYNGKIHSANSLYYTHYWYGTTIQYQFVTYEATVANWYSFIDNFKKQAKKAGYAYSAATTLAKIAMKLLTTPSKALGLLLTALDITIAFVSYIAKGILDKIEKNLRYKSKKSLYCFNLYAIQNIQGLFGNAQNNVLYYYTKGVYYMFG